MDFTSGPEEKITVKLDGVEYPLRQPLVGDLRQLSALGDMSGDKLMESIISFLTGIGMPEDKLNNLSLKTLKDIFVFVTTPKKSE